MAPTKKAVRTLIDPLPLPFRADLSSVDAVGFSLIFYRCALQKKSTENINNKLQLVMKSGKYTLGYRTVLKTLRSSKGTVLLPLLTL
jgi:hypothetical protein